ncbi:MAG: uracil-DNA glycosylase [Ruminococcaceae bacterium]|nr:uracil-DNA glycosylase [Oscillospiraceae bacterium]
MTQTKNEKMELLEQRVSSCRGCSLCTTRTQSVFGKGSFSPTVLFVGEAPGEQEDREGKPFVGPAGKLLDLYIEFIGLEEDDYYVANILKCRPPRNRDPLPEEEEACLPYLREQLRLLQPKILVCLGRIAAKRIISPDFRITKQRGIWYDLGGLRVMATYHPSALLRDPAKKEEALTDFKKIAEEIKKFK